MRVVVVAAVAAGSWGCWTGAPPEPTPIVAPPRARAPAAFYVRLERTPCAGDVCPVYAVDVDARQRIARFQGDDTHVSRLTNADIERVKQAIVRARFFEREENGLLPMKPTCTSDGTTTTCTIGGSIPFCPARSDAIITVRQGGKTHRIDYDFCNQDDALTDLVRTIDDVSRTGQWTDHE